MARHISPSRGLILGLLALAVLPASLFAQSQVQCFSLEFFYDSGVNDAAELRADLEAYAESRGGLKLHFRDVKDSDEEQKRVAEIAKYFGLKELKLPAIYGLKNVLADLQNKEQQREKLDEILTLTAYVRDGCPHCRAVKEFLTKYESRYPALKIVYKEVIKNANYNDEMNRVVQRYRQRAASLPVVHYCNGLTIGFDRESTTGQRIMQTLDYWCTTCDVKKK